MARFMVKASEFKNVCKAVNDRKLAELKKEIIEILKKQDEKEVKKAVDYFDSQELHYTHLEKSLNGKWVEKAGYGVGTVRIWKGKKYKKIAPGKWARVFEKEGRGANIAVGKLISKVNAIKDEEELLRFVEENKQRFVDDNGKELAVVEKLKAAIGSKGGESGSKGTSKPAEKKTDSKDDLQAALKEVEDAIDNAGDYDDIEELENERQKILKKLEKNEKPAEKKKTFKQEMNQLYDAQDEAWEGFESGSDIKSSSENSKKFYERVKKFVDDNNIKLSQKHYDEIEDSNGHSFNEALELAGAYGEEKKEKALAKNREYSKKYEGQFLDLSMIDEFKTEEKPADTKESDYVQKKREAKEGYWSDEFKERNLNNIKQRIASMKEDGASDKKVKAYLEETIETNSNDIPWRERAIEEGRVKGNQANDYRDTIQERTVRIENCKQLLKEYNSEENKTYWIQDSRGNRITSEDAKARIKDQLNQINSFNELIAERSKADGMKMEVAKRSLEEDNKYLMDRLNPEDRKEIESEFEKTKNRSENARHFGTDWEESRKEIQSKLVENTDKMLEGYDKSKDVYEKLQSNLDKRKADAELYRKYLGNQEEPEDVKDFRKWCDDVIEQYRKEVTYTPSKEIISKWEETAKNTPTEKLEEVYNGKQKVDYSNEYENYIDSTIINTFAKDKDLIFPQPYTILKDIATRKFDNSDKIRLEVIKKELESRKKGKNVEKSLFDDLFEIDIIAADELEDEEELKENETEYNDYTAEQPELFNSPEFAVREALNRRFNCR